MILYTAVPEEQIWATSGDVRASAIEWRIGRALLILEPLGDMRVRVVRLISPDPQDYLRADCLPGTVWDLRAGGPV
ncbi:MAG: YlzJ-like family protein [Alicyclobacillaceae bacterium]|nr:YlzJ-like family protein [Alicyclobacillaceae bacterium]